MRSVRDFANRGLFKETGGIEESRIWDEMQTYFLLLPQGLKLRLQFSLGASFIWISGN